MVIRRLAIKNFGKISHKTLTLTPGINVLYGENESGKTTIHTFIKSMFYGMHRSRGRAAKNDPFARYEPWDNPAEYGGTIWFENGGKLFRLSRSFAKERTAEELYCETDGELLDLDEGDLDMLLGGVSETAYENTVSIAQLKSVTGRELVQELQNYMASYEGTGDASVDLGRAVQMLKMTRKGFSVQEERTRRAQETERQKLQTNFDYITQELENLDLKKSAQNEKNNQDRSVARKDKKALEEYQQVLKRKQKLLSLGMIFTLLIMTMTSVLFSQFSFGFAYIWILPLLLGIVALLAELFYMRKLRTEWFNNRKLQRRIKKQEDKRSWDEGSLNEIYVEKQTDLNNLKMEMLDFDRICMQPSRAKTEVDAINLAMETMEQLTEQYRSHVGNKLKKRTSGILSEITDGKYREVWIDEEFRIQVQTEERFVPLESLSRGTLEQIYFALRMAAGELFCEEEHFPVILDDVFGMYDEERLAAVLHWLEREPRQVIISTCNKREMEIMEREGITFHELLIS